MRVCYRRADICVELLRVADDTVAPLLLLMDEVDLSAEVPHFAFDSSNALLSCRLLLV